MKKLRDFKCQDGHTLEKRVEDSTYFCLCHCGKQAKRLISGCGFKVNGAGAFDSGKFRGKK